MAISTETERLLIPEVRRTGWDGWWKSVSLAWPRQKIIADSFRLAAFLAATIQIAAFPNGPGYKASELTGWVWAALIYTILKIAQPFKWQRARTINVILLFVDITAAMVLVHFAGSIHSPFILYPLVPVLTAALLKNYMVTVVVSIVTGAYVLAGNIYSTFANNVPMLQAVNDFLVYSIALGLVAVLPYSINLTLKRRLQSSAAIEERLRISRELHDSVCQALCGLRWQVQHLSEGVRLDECLSGELKKMETAVDVAEHDARKLMGVLHSIGTTTPFLSDIKGYLEQLRCDAGIDYELDCDDADVQLQETVEHELLMICGEALTNVRKHAGARKVSLSARTTDRRMQIKIADDGFGFDESDTAISSGHGLTIMRERAASLGGTLHIVSARGKGTEIEIEVPRDAGGGRK